MNALFVLSVASLAAFSAASGIGIGAVVKGPSGIVTNAGPIGPTGPAGHGLVAAPLVAPAAWAAPVAPAAWAAPVVAPAIAPVAVAAPLALGAVTNGGGTIGVNAHGAAIRGPPTAPVVVAGPAGKVAADGLWGPTANIGLLGGYGKLW